MATPEIRPAETAPHPELLRSLGRLVRGLSGLFWGLPIALVIGVESAQTDFLAHVRVFPSSIANVIPPGIIPAAAAAAWLMYALAQLAHFQKQERIWISALDRARLLALINFGLSPFLYWWNRLPQVTFFTIAVEILAASGLFFLGNLNLVLYRLSRMLPDENLRQETRHFTTFNRLLVLVILLCGGALGAVMHYPQWFPGVSIYVGQLAPAALWVLLFLVLLPLAVTMALLWKIKQVILDSVFGG